MALILDTGPLYASLDRADAAHESCKRLIAGSRERIVIPAPVLVEVDYFAGQNLRPEDFSVLLSDIEAGAYLVEDLQLSDYTRVREICGKYADSDIGFVDAAVLAVVERLGETKLATLDHRHFRMLRPRHTPSLTLLPEIKAS